MLAGTIPPVESQSVADSQQHVCIWVAGQSWVTLFFVTFVIVILWCIKHDVIVYGCENRDGFLVYMTNICKFFSPRQSLSLDPTLPAISASVCYLHNVLSWALAAHVCSLSLIPFSQVIGADVDWWVLQFNVRLNTCMVLVAVCLCEYTNGCIMLYIIHILYILLPPCTFDGERYCHIL